MLAAVFWVVAHLDPVSAAEPNVSVSVSVDKSEITIGDIVTLTAAVRYPEGVEVQIPSLGEKLGDFLIRDIKLPPAYKDPQKNEYVLNAIYQVTTYLTGDVAIPSAKISYSFADAAGNKVEKTIDTDALTIHVKRTAPKDATDIKDIKGPVDLPINWRPYLLWSVVTIAILALGAGIIYYIKRIRPKVIEAAKLAPPGPPRDIALKELERIAAMNLIEDGKFDIYYDLVTDALRRYMGARYNFNAIDMTTSEVVSSLDGRLRRLDLKDQVSMMLRESDMVKFAKLSTTTDRADTLMKDTRRIINETTPGVSATNLLGEQN